ncbi:MAG TPA: hypothetical protein VF786_15690 [Terriglobales bacterium]
MLLLRSIVASLWPQKIVRWWHPAEPRMLLPGAVISGLVELLLFGYLELLQFEKHFAANAQHFSPGNETTQLVALIVVVAAELFYPLSLLLIFLAIEGFIRTISAGFIGQVLPSLPVMFAVRLWARRHRATPEIASR